MTSRRFFAAATFLGLVLAAASAVVGAQGQEPIARAMRQEAARLASALVVSGQSAASEQTAENSLGNWASVTSLEAGSEILLTTTTSASTRHRLLSVQDDSLTILDVASPLVPDAVADELRDRLDSRHAMFSEVRQGNKFVLGRDVVVESSGVSRSGDFLFPLSHIVVDVPRADVVELRAFRRHVRRGAIRGAIIAPAVVAVMGAITCTSDCFGRTGVGILVASSLIGTLYGASLGALPTPDVVYRQ